MEIEKKMSNFNFEQNTLKSLSIVKKTEREKKEIYNDLKLKEEERKKKEKEEESKK